MTQFRSRRHDGRHAEKDGFFERLAPARLNVIPATMLFPAPTLLMMGMVGGKLPLATT